MPRSISCLLIILLILSPTLPYAQEQEKNLDAIRKEFRSINSDSTLRAFSVDQDNFLDHNPDGGASLVGYYKKEHLRKIVRFIGLSNGNETVEYYFNNDKLIFVYETFGQFHFNDTTQTMDLGNTDLSFEGRYYFNDQRLVDSIYIGTRRFTEDEPDPEKRLIDQASEYQTVLANKLRWRRKNN